MGPRVPHSVGPLRWDDGFASEADMCSETLITRSGHAARII